mmetsp:Transcript_2217/g.4672  ORF Transcript_2217/g.4672 Transcript_2217/m.4672 type:complete len:212 (+) Transcript_2217:181-816(+)
MLLRKVTGGGLWSLWSCIAALLLLRCTASLPESSCEAVSENSCEHGRALMQQTARARQPMTDVYATPLSAIAEEQVKAHKTRSHFNAADSINEDLGPSEVMSVGLLQSEANQTHSKKAPGQAVSLATAPAGGPEDLSMEQRKVRRQWQATSAKMVLLLDSFFIWPEEVQGQSALVQQVVSFSMLGLFLVMVVASLVFLSVWKVPPQQHRRF